MNRILSVIVATYGFFFGMTPGATVSQPNVVLFIAAEDLNDWIGCLGGHPQSGKPHLERLDATSVFFKNAHCAAPACKLHAQEG